MTALSLAVNAGPQVDAVMIYGFVVGFFTIVLVIYRNDLKSTLPLLGVLLAGLAVYGFMQGSWPLGFVMVALAGSELRRWWQSPNSVPVLPTVEPVSAKRQIQVCEARMSRMFGA